MMNNVLDAMEGKLGSGYKVQVGAERQARNIGGAGDYQPKLTVRTFQKYQSVIIEIEDNGPGIPNEIKDKFLQPFFSSQKVSKGAAFGLSITHDIEKAHGGVLKIESEAEKGSLLTIQMSSK